MVWFFPADKVTGLKHESIFIALGLLLHGSLVLAADRP